MIRQAVCNICHNNMNFEKFPGVNVSTANYHLTIWFCPNCGYWIPTNASGDGALLYREIKLIPDNKKYQEWKDKVYKIMLDKFWDKYELCESKNFEFCNLSFNSNYCPDCGKLFPNESGKFNIEINTSWIKKVK